MAYLAGLLSAVCGYLLGSADGAILMGKGIWGVDVREYGSGNAGTTNVMRVMGWRIALLTLFVDMAKGALAVAAGIAIQRYLHSCAYPELYPAIAALSAIVGHDWPIYFNFRGGKGVATTLGAALALMPFCGLAMTLSTVLVIAMFRYVSLGSIVAFIILPPLTGLVLYTGNTVLILWAICVSAMGIWAHRANVKRLLSGSENKLKILKTGIAPRKNERGIK